jgi:flavin-dependent dehydrogenase
VIEADVAVVGAGPAGAAAALALAGRARVVLVDRRAEPEDRIGETLPGAARRLLAGLGLDAEAVMGDGHEPVWARRSVWGAAQPAELDALADPAGPGVRLDRRRFEARLRAEAAGRGVRLVAPAAARVARAGEGWTVEAGAVRISAPLLVDAGGRGSRLLREQAGRPAAEDRLVCVWTHLPLVRPAQAVTYVESEPDGWWYTAPLPGGRRLLAFHTDADLLRAAGVHRRLLERALALPSLAAELSGADTGRPGAVRTCAAHGARPGAAGGDGWLAVGDASMCFDPLSSQGLFHALYTGLTAARAALAMLGGEARAGAEYSAALDPVWDAYVAHRALYYGMERRWPDAPFWRRRLPPNPEKQHL